MSSSEEASLASRSSSSRTTGEGAIQSRRISEHLPEQRRPIEVTKVKGGRMLFEKPSANINPVAARAVAWKGSGTGRQRHRRGKTRLSVAEPEK
ncbi:hypothetical protein CDAR_274331 [Caerostris darwini]|uniref:Uncharacterized protein n=1 Tax=Caerostris darwini TaxID=1538125 RepID=A0AAV4RGB0_9ARAC|nr:hypothetical protein CDAR_274331 [Caerostris darwini]